VTAAKDRAAAERATYRLDSYPARLAAAGTAALRLSCAYDWFRAAAPTARVTEAAARELARLAKRADEGTAALAEAASRA
jgi:hypothetical protein